MSIQTRPGPVVADADDLVIEHRGQRVLVKILAVGFHPSINAYSQAVGATTWNAEGPVDCAAGDRDSIFSNDNDQGMPMTPSDWIAKFGGPRGFVATFVVPRLNEILARIWPAQTGAPSGDPLQQVHAVIAGLRVVKAADATVRVEMP